MAKKLFKIVVSASTTTDAVPTVKRYFTNYSTTQLTTGSSTVTLPYTKFFNDAGTSLTGTVHLQTLTTNNGYYLLFINGVLQESSLYTIGAGGTAIKITQGTTITNGVPVVLAVNNFAPTSTTTVST